MAALPYSHMRMRSARYYRDTGHVQIQGEKKFHSNWSAGELRWTIVPLWGGRVASQDRRVAPNCPRERPLEILACVLPWDRRTDLQACPVRAPCPDRKNKPGRRSDARNSF